MQNVMVLKAILRCFELISGLKINFAKSQFGTICKSEDWRKEAADYLNSSVLSMPFVYLGIPIGANPRHSAIWEPVVRKCKRKKENDNCDR